MLNRYLLEFLGTLLITYVFLFSMNPIAVGATVALCILLIAPVSGGYFNPALTVVMGAANRLPVAEIIPYSVSQILGGLVAFEMYKRVQF